MLRFDESNNAMSCRSNSNGTGEMLPVLYFHGVDGSAGDAGAIFDVLSRHNASTLCAWPQYSGRESVTTNLLTQAEEAKKWLRAISSQGMPRYQLICHSMGALLCRMILQTMDDHRAAHVIFIAGALEGVYGPSGIWRRWFPHQTVPTTWILAYTRWVQDVLSVANLWHDPMHFDAYLKGNIVLPLFDGYKAVEEGESDDDHRKRIASYRRNWQRIGSVVCLASNADEMVIPWQSAHFGFYAHGSTKEMVPFDNRLTSATLGLKEMEAQGRFTLIQVPKIKHTTWIDSEAVIEKHIVPLIAYNKDI